MSCGSYGKSLLSHQDILQAYRSGDIFIDPFDESHIGTNSYDVKLGKHFWKETDPANNTFTHRVKRGTLYNFYDKNHINHTWEQQEAQPASDVILQHEKLKGIRPDDLVILLEPGEVVLGHTEEFIGGASNRITTIMKARSTIGRNFIEISRCAGSGDVGYHNRWTLELTNNSRYHTIPLVVGRRIGQLLFFEVTPVDKKYYDLGKYQLDSDPEKIKAAWDPKDMLPKAYKDRELEEPMRKSTSFRLSFYAAMKGRNRPSANMFQLAASQLSESIDKPTWHLNEDGLFGPGTEKVAREIQEHYGLGPVDGIVGKGTWRALTPDLGTWRPPLRLRIAECQCTWEAGDDGYGYYGMIGWEGWWNYGIWNVNRGSARSLVYMGSAFNLIAIVNQADEEGNTSEGRDLAAKVASWFKYEGKDIQIGEYFIEKTLKPSIRNLIFLGWDPQKLGLSKPDEIEDVTTIEDVDGLLGKVDPFHERLILQACDITVNSGPGNYFPNKSPRAWGGHGDEAWPEDKLPPKEEVKRVFGEVFGQEIPNDYTYLTASHPDDTYRDALKRSLDELCKNDEQRINLIGELQARCVIGKWRGDVIRRRRAVAWKEGHAFQGSFYCMGEHFGIGL